MRWFARRRPAVDILTPVYRAEAFLAETLESILAQDFDDFRLTLAVEPTDDRSAAICRDYAGRDRRLTVIENRTRRGFANNCNLLTRRATAPYAVFAPHDDVMDPGALAAMVAALEAAPQAAAIAPVMTGIGQAARNPPPTVAFSGDRTRRCEDFVLNHLGNAVYRGLFRLDPDRRKRPVFPASPPDDFAVDLAWSFQILRAGEITFAPGAVIAKRFYPGSTSAKWLSQPSEGRSPRYAEVAAMMLRFAADAPEDERERLRDAAIGWLAALGLSQTARASDDMRTFRAEVFPKAYRHLRRRLGPTLFGSDETPAEALRRLKNPEGPLAASLALRRAQIALKNKRLDDAAAALDQAEAVDPKVSYLPALRAQLAKAAVRRASEPAAESDFRPS